MITIVRRHGNLHGRHAACMKAVACQYCVVQDVVFHLRPSALSRSVPWSQVVWQVYETYSSHGDNECIGEISEALRSVW